MEEQPRLIVLTIPMSKEVCESLERLQDLLGAKSLQETIARALATYGVEQRNGYWQKVPEPVDREKCCPNCGGTKFVPPIAGTIGRRCVKCCDVSDQAKYGGGRK